MGGEREQVLDAAKPTATATKKPSVGKLIKLGTAEKIRVHENKGEVHFHDDKAKLKVAVPCDRFCEEWDKFNPAQKGAIISFYDTENQTVVVIEATPPQFQSGQIEMDVSIRIEKTRIGGNLKKMLEFAAGK